MTETVSIIIPTRNRAPVLELCLNALAHQHTNGYFCNVIVVDDCSSDETQAVVQASVQSSPFGIELLRQPRSLGANAARNRGLEKSTGDIIIFIDDDVLVPPGWLHRLVKGLREGSHPVTSGAVKLTLDGEYVGKHRCEIGTYLGEILSPPLGVNGDTVPVLGNMAAYRWVFDRARFDPVIRPPMEECDWMLRAGVTAGFVPEAWAWHYKTGDELRLRRVLRGSWHRGSEGGWWMRERQRMMFSKRLRLAMGGIRTCGRAVGHAVLHRCWGGAVIAAGELSRAMSLVGLTNRGRRLPASWR